MKIAVIQGSSQKDKNDLIFSTINQIVKEKGNEVINFGVFQDEDVEYLVKYGQGDELIELLKSYR